MLILYLQCLLPGRTREKYFVFIFLKNFLTKLKPCFSSKDQLFILCRGPCSHLILQRSLGLSFPSCEPLDCSYGPHLLHLYFFVGFEVFQYFSIFYSDLFYQRAGIYRSKEEWVLLKLNTCGTQPSSGLP